MEYKEIVVVVSVRIKEWNKGGLQKISYLKLEQIYS
jgi:hypothetical protein